MQPTTQQTMTINQFSLATTPIFLLEGDREIVQGTGFFYGKAYTQGMVVFLVTNYHVLTGSPPLGSRSLRGDNIIFQIHRSANDIRDVKTIRLPLFGKYHCPIWITDTHNVAADMAMIPLLSTLVEEGCIWIISEHLAVECDALDTAPAVTLVGYPDDGYSIGGARAVWKTGTLATEPAQDIGGGPLVLENCAIVPGMSGAPVFLRSNGSVTPAYGEATAQGVMRFVGIYASKIPENEEMYLEELSCEPHYSSQQLMQLAQSLKTGYVWQAALIAEAINRTELEASQYATQHYRDAALVANKRVL